MDPKQDTTTPKSAEALKASQPNTSAPGQTKLPPAPQEPAVQKVSKPTVLIIEDDPLLTKMYQTKFNSEGLNVIIAHDGEEGLRIAVGQKVDFVLLDVMMPKLSGIDLLARLRQDPKGKDLPVLILSNLTKEEEIKKALELGAKEYIVKANETPAQVVNKVKKYLGIATPSPSPQSQPQTG